mgnify:CR=1 FL=1
MKRYALLGERLSHSHSPLIHQEIYKDMHIEAEYELLEVARGELSQVIDLLRSKKYCGFNVTIPYKVEIMQYLDEISPEAKEIGSVNTVACKDGRIIGYNTDYFGFYQELLYYGVQVQGKNCFILGTGGASLAVEKAVRDMGGNTRFVSRNPKTDKTIAYDDLKNYRLDLIVNTTPVGMYPNTEQSPLDKMTACQAGQVIDIIFNPRRTKLLQEAGSEMNGLFMLVGQAVKAEEIWQDKSYDLPIADLLKRIEMMI